MDLDDTKVQSAHEAEDSQEERPGRSYAARADAALAPTVRVETCTCGRPGGKCRCGESGGSQAEEITPSYVYSIGRIEPRFPNLSVEREFAQVRALEKRATAGKTERETLYVVLSKYRYLARQMCYVLTVQGVETYILQPSDPADFGLLLVEALKPPADTAEVRFDVVIGVRGPIAQPDRCEGLMVPVVAFEQVYSFTKESLLESIPVPASLGETGRKLDSLTFRRSSEEIFDRIIQMADNAGATDEHRALNYSAVRHPGVYARVAQEHAENRSLTAVEVRRSPITNARSVMDVVFAFTDRATDVVEKYFCRVDVTGEFPFLVTKLSPYYER
jgi:PatG C-terminal